jgi:hypothetical protein
MSQVEIYKGEVQEIDKALRMLRDSYYRRSQSAKSKENREIIYKKYQKIDELRVRISSQVYQDVYGGR